MQIQFEGMNPNLKESSTKDGMVRRVSFELDQDTYDAIKQFNLKGMIVSGVLDVVEGSLFKEELKGGKNAIGAAQLCRTPMFQKYADIMLGKGITEECAAEFLKDRCGIESRKELDHNDIALQKYHQLVIDFNFFIKNVIR